MKMRRLILPLGGLAIALAGCGPVTRGVESVNQPVVSRTDYVLDLAENGSTLASGEDGRLAAWFDALGVGYGDRVTVDDPSPSRPTRDAIARVAAGYGLLLGDTAPMTGGTIPSSSVRVVLSRSRAGVPNCPNWSRSSNPELAASATSNYGCAINGNLAAMVADPQDLIQGQVASDGDAVAATRAINSYRRAEPSGAGGTAIKIDSASGKGGK